MLVIHSILIMLNLALVFYLFGVISELNKDLDSLDRMQDDMIRWHGCLKKEIEQIKKEMK